MAQKCSARPHHMMPRDFLWQLPKVQNIAADDNICGVCLDEYRPAEAPAPGYIASLISMVVGPRPAPIDPESECAVRLPCQHVIGFNCIKRWISPSEGGHTSCPYVSCPLLNILFSSSSPPTCKQQTGLEIDDTTLLLKPVFKLKLSLPGRSRRQKLIR